MKKIISTGNNELDDLIPCGGFPSGKIVELYGPPDIGKTKFALQFIANAQKDDNIVLYIDADRKLDIGKLEQNNVNSNLLILLQPKSSDENKLLYDIKSILSLKVCDIVVIDSIAFFKKFWTENSIRYKKNSF